MSSSRPPGGRSPNTSDSSTELTTLFFEPLTLTTFLPPGSCNTFIAAWFLSARFSTSVALTLRFLSSVRTFKVKLATWPVSKVLSSSWMAVSDSTNFSISLTFSSLSSLRVTIISWRSLFSTAKSGPFCLSVTCFSASLSFVFSLVIPSRTFLDTPGTKMFPLLLVERLNRAILSLALFNDSSACFHFASSNSRSRCASVS